MPRTPDSNLFSPLSLGGRNITKEEMPNLLEFYAHAAVAGYGTFHDGSGTPYQVPTLKKLVPVAMELIGETAAINEYNWGYGDNSVGHNGGVPTTPIYAYGVAANYALAGFRSDSSTGANFSNFHRFNDQSSDAYFFLALKYPFFHMISGSGAVKMYAFLIDV